MDDLALLFLTANIFIPSPITATYACPAGRILIDFSVSFFQVHPKGIYPEGKFGTRFFLFVLVTHCIALILHDIHIKDNLQIYCIVSDTKAQINIFCTVTIRRNSINENIFGVREWGEGTIHELMELHHKKIKNINLKSEF